MADTLILLESSPTFFLTIVFIVSLMVGSFLNVVIHRLPIMMETSWRRDYQSYFEPDANENAGDATTKPFNLVKPDSTCPHCGHAIRAWENIPIISWLLLRGKCSNCGADISARYPLVELLTGVASVTIAWHFGYGLAAVMGVVFTWMLIAMTFIDLDKMLLPDQLTLPLLWLGLILSVDSVFVTSTDAIIGAVAGYLSLWSVYWLFKLLTGKEGMGYGDFKLLAALGAWLGWQHLATVILMSSVVGAIIGIASLKLQNKSQSQPIPFGPYLAIAGWLTLLAGDEIATAYWQWITA